MVKKWVTESFRHILVDNCQAYLDSNDHGKDKDRTQLIDSVADLIRLAAGGQDLPVELNKAVATWFGNEARNILGLAGEAPHASVARVRSANPGKVWTARLVAQEMFSDRWDEIYQRHRREYSGDPKEINLRTSAPALTELMEQLSDAELQECQERAKAFNAEPAPKDVQRRATKRLPTVVKRFLQSIKKDMGATIHMLVSFENQEGEGSISWFETEGSSFSKDKPNWRKGPGNILDMWRDWANDQEEQAGDEEKASTVILDHRPGDGYPLLPVLDSNTSLDVLKQVLRDYVREVRVTQGLTGRPPWAAIRADNAGHLHRQSKVNGHLLQDPSRMGQKSVLAFLTHWRERQEVGKDWPLKFTQPPRQHHDAGKKDGQDGRVATQEGKSSEMPKSTEALEGHEDSGQVEGTKDAEQGRVGGSTGGKGKAVADRFTAPAQVDTSLRKPFLKSLSNLPAYHQLITLLDVADTVSDSDAIGISGPNWGHWGYSKPFLPPAFHNPDGPNSFSGVLTWLRGHPLTLSHGGGPSYQLLEQTILILGLTLRELTRVLFTEEESSEEHPGYLRSSSLNPPDWLKALQACEALLRDIGIHSDPGSQSGKGSGARVQSPGKGGNASMAPTQRAVKRRDNPEPDDKPQAKKPRTARAKGVPDGQVIPGPSPTRRTRAKAATAPSPVHKTRTRGRNAARNSPKRAKR